RIGQTFAAGARVGAGEQRRAVFMEFRGGDHDPAEGEVDLDVVVEARMFADLAVDDRQFHDPEGGDPGDVFVEIDQDAVAAFLGPLLFEGDQRHRLPGFPGGRVGQANDLSRAYS